MVYSRHKKAVSRSLEIRVAENKVTNDSPKTAIPGVKRSISNRLYRYVCLYCRKQAKQYKRKAKPEKRVSRSLNISLAVLEEKAHILIS